MEDNMKISGKNPLVDAQVKAQEAAKELKIRQKSSGNKASGTLFDKVDVSGKGKRLAGVRKLVEASPDVREEKIRQIKGAVRDGTYEIKTSRIAERIIRSAIHYYKTHRPL